MRRLKNCATHNCRPEEWDYDYVPDEGDEGDLPTGDDVQGWSVFYGAAIMLATIAAVTYCLLKVCIAAHKSGDSLGGSDRWRSREHDDRAPAAPARTHPEISAENSAANSAERFTTEYRYRSV